MQKHKQAKLLKRIPSFYFILNSPKREDVTSFLFYLPGNLCYEIIG